MVSEYIVRVKKSLVKYVSCVEVVECISELKAR
jgi:hypothetical protein